VREEPFASSRWQETQVQPQVFAPFYRLGTEEKTGSLIRAAVGLPNRTSHLPRRYKSSDMAPPLSYAQAASHGSGSQAPASSSSQSRTSEPRSTPTQSALDQNDRSIDQRGSRLSRETQQSTTRQFHDQHQQHRGAYTASEYVRPADQRPKTDVSDESHYIISLQTDDHLHKTMTDLRAQYFPRHLNKLSAHIALFRALPGSRLSRIEEDITSICAQTAPFPLSTNAKPMRLRSGVAVQLAEGKDGARQLYQKLKTEWNEFLSQQDKSFAPHWTVQNKVDDETEVERTMQEVRDQLATGLQGTAVGLGLFKYEKGYWKFVRKYPLLGGT